MVVLRNYQMQVAEQFAAYKNNPIIFSSGYDKVPNPFTISDAKAYIKLQIEKKEAVRKLVYWNDQFVGEIGIDIKDDVYRLTAEIGYFIGEPFWGKGIATKAIQFMTEYVFNHLNIIRIEAIVYEYNKASMRVLEKNDFYLESIKKNGAFKNGKIIDDYVWVKLKKLN